MQQSFQNSALVYKTYGSRGSPCTCSEYETVCCKTHAVSYVGQSKQVTSMHFKMERVGKDVDVVQAPAAMAGYVQNAIPFKQGWARKPKRQRGVACLPEIKQFLRDCFLAANDDQGEINHLKKNWQIKGA